MIVVNTAVYNNHYDLEGLLDIRMLDSFRSNGITASVMFLMQTKPVDSTHLQMHVYFSK
jgi:hypothetical protein